MTATIDFDAVFKDLKAQSRAERELRRQPPLVRFWDGNWNFRGKVTRVISADVTEMNNETGTATFELPLDYYISQWIVDIDSRATMNVHVTIDKDGIRWSGRMDSFSVEKKDDGTRTLRVAFKHDYEELKHIIIYPNPWLPPEIQFPRLWVLFGPSKWALKLTLMFAIMRLESSIWTLPDDPMDPAQWFNFNQSTWSMVVAPSAIEADNSIPAIVHARMKTMHECSRKITEDAQLTWTFRRFLNGDPEPWPGANLRHGCLIIDLVDKSGFTHGTSFGGNIFAGLIHAFFDFDSEGLEEGIDIINDPNLPEEYGESTFVGTLPQAPWVVYRDGPRTGIQSSEFTFKPATDVGTVGGGHSMPGVNELIGAAINMIGDLTAMIPGVPPLGGVADAILKPLYTDVFLAFGKWKSPGRAQRLGWSHYHEHWAEGADRAYTLAWLLAMRTGMWVTREQTSHSVKVIDGAPYKIGAQGYGHFYLGDRIGSTIAGMPPGRVFIDRVSQVRLSWDRDKAPVWEITIGARDPQDPVIKAWEQIQDIIGLVRDLGLV